MLPKLIALAATLGVLLVGSAATPSPAPPPPLAVVSALVEHDPQGTVHLIGEVVNQSVRSYGHVQVVAFLYAADGTVTAATAAFTLLSVLRPGQRSPFDLNFAHARGRHYAAIVRGAPVRVSPPVLDVTGLTMRAVGKGIYRVQGWVTNTRPAVISYVEVVATLYGPSGQLAGFGLGAPDTPSVAVHRKARFAVTAVAGGRVAHVVVQVQGTQP